MRSGAMSKHDSPFHPLLVTFGLLLMLVSATACRSTVRLEVQPVDASTGEVIPVVNVRLQEHRGPTLCGYLLRGSTGRILKETWIHCSDSSSLVLRCPVGTTRRTHTAVLSADGYQDASVRLRLARMVVWSPEGSPVEPGWPVVPSDRTSRWLDHGGSPVRVPLFREMPGSVP